MKYGRAALRRLASAVRSLDRAAGRAAGRRRVLVEARTPMNLAVLRPVFEPLLRDPRVDVRFTGRDRDDLAGAYREMGIEGQVLPRRAVQWRRFDLYMNADPWEAVPLSRTARQVNFFHGVAGKYNLDCPTGLPLGFDRYDRVAFPNEGRRDSYVAAGIVPPDRAVLVGFPKLDALVTAAGNPRAAAAGLGLDASRPTVIFAPTFSPASALDVAGLDILRALLDAGCNVIAKLHDRSLDPDPRYNGGVSWRERLSVLAGPRFLLAQSGDSTRYVLASDVMVTDHSTIGFEFCAIDRPLIVFDAPRLVEAARINQEKVALLRAAAIVVSDCGTLAEAVRECLASPGARSAERRRAASDAFFGPGGATARALGLLYEMLDLPPAPDPVASPGHRRQDAFSAAK